MADTEPAFGRVRRYRFSRPGEIETREFNSDDAAEAYARELSRSQVTPVIVERHDLVDWEYLVEVDDRP